MIAQLKFMVLMIKYKIISFITELECQYSDQSVTIESDSNDNI